MGNRRGYLLLWWRLGEVGEVVYLDSVAVSQEINDLLPVNESSSSVFCTDTFYNTTLAQSISHPPTYLYQLLTTVVRSTVYSEYQHSRQNVL